MILEIKRVVNEDVSTVALLFDAYRVFYKQPSDFTGAFEFLNQRLLKNESVIFLAFFGEDAVGFVQLYPTFSSVQLKPAWLLNDLFVTENARRKGVAEALLDQTKEFAKENNAAGLILQTAADNYMAQSVYEKNGWIKEQDFFYVYAI